VLPPAGNPLRIEIEQAARARGVTLPVPVEVEGIRLIADLVAAGAGVSVLPETAIPPELSSVVIFTIANLPPRRLALISQKAAPLSLADQAVRETVLQIVGDERALPLRAVRPPG
jgi:DNA-binding transcriptional LysR family regulator